MAQPAHALEETIGPRPAAPVAADTSTGAEEAALPEEIEERWCVDHGEGMEVMSAPAIRAALESGRLRPSQRVWRDGHACWQPIADFGELMPADLAPERAGRLDLTRLDEAFDWAFGRLDDDEAEVPERSGPRRIRRPAPSPAGGEKARAFLGAVGVGILLGGLLFLPYVGAAELAPDLTVKARDLLARIGP